MTGLRRGGTSALPLTLRLSELPDAEIATTIVSYEEQCKGWLAKTAREKDAGLVRAYAQLAQNLEIYASIHVLSYDERAHTFYLTLQRQKIRVGTQDMKIASIALANDTTLLTRNTQDFARIPSLKVEDWTV